MQSAVGHSQEISRQVGEVVVSIQFHDSMNQRIQHIIKALQDLEQLLGEEGSGFDNKKRKRERTGSAYSILRLQAAQLKQVIDEIDEVYQKSSEAFDRIRQEASRLALSLKAFGSEDKQACGKVHGQGEDSFVALITTLKCIQKLLHEVLNGGQQMIDGILNMSAKVSASTDRLMNQAGNLLGISFDTKIIALNAIVKAMHLWGSGRPIFVLAQEVARLSDQSNLIVRRVEEVLEPISLAVRQLRQQTEEQQKRLHSVSEVRQSLNTGIDGICSAYMKFKQDSEQVFKRAELLDSAIAGIRDELEFLPVLAGELSKRLLELEQMEDALGVKREAGGYGRLKGGMKQLAGRYTMKKEREVHMGLIGGKQQGEGLGKGDMQPRCVGGQEAPADGDLGENVELF
ncbi:MAG: hypothetical protein JRH18_03045 [Deltaproteobacteria bacterium]|nr:hypothetical protein [Deltaproteobacteria bacterium]MBW2150626.1 hypothetical protein [Deltaproteobacteria bacterium]